MAETDPMYDFRTDVLRVVGHYREVDFVPVADFAVLPGHVYFKSVSWAEEVFREGVGPFDVEGVAHSYHVAGEDSLDWDIVRHAYRAAGCMVDVREGSGFYKIRFSAYDPRAFGGPDTLKQASRLAATFFRMEPPTFVLLGQDSAGRAVMSSGPEKTLTQMGSWEGRIDAVRTTDGIIMVLYKRHFELQEAIDFNKWFPEDFRRDPKAWLDEVSSAQDADEE